MSKEIVGEHYCQNHQGNHSHYAEHNCVVCKLQAELAESEAKVKELEEVCTAREMGWDEVSRKLDTAQAELAELRKQEPYSFAYISENQDGFKQEYIDRYPLDTTGMKSLYATPVPSPDDNRTTEMYREYYFASQPYIDCGRGWTIHKPPKRGSEEQERFTAACRAIDQAIKTKGE